MRYINLHLTLTLTLTLSYAESRGSRIYRIPSLLQPRCNGSCLEVHMFSICEGSSSLTQFVTGNFTEYKPVVCLGDALAMVDFFIHATSVPSQKYNNAVTTANQRKTNKAICSRHLTKSQTDIPKIYRLKNVRRHVCRTAQQLYSL